MAPVRPPSPAQSHHSSRSALSILTLRSDRPPPSGDGDDDAPPSPITATRLVKIEVHRKLTWWDVSALIINKMIGTGIFTGPPVILSYTGKKSNALWLWAAGLVYTLLSMTVYLEFSRKLPYTGGELVYLDKILPRPILLTYTCYSLYFVCLYTTATNSMQFARQVIMAATKSDDIPDQRVMRLIAVVIMSLICLLLYFSTATGRKLNRYLAWLKIGLMIIIFIAGGVKAGKGPAHDINWKFKSAQSNSAIALLQVLYAYQGWENATLVAGEIPDLKTLRKGFIRGVWIVGILYMLINIVYCYAVPWGPDGKLELQYVPLFFGNSERAQTVWNVLAAFSAVGSMISVTYTCVRVKQTIAWSNILPWSTFWRTSAPVRVKDPTDAMELQHLMPHPADDDEPAPVLRTGAPQGGIALHWVACVFYICVSSAIPVVTEAISFSGLLLTYGHAIWGVAIGLFFPVLSRVEYDLPDARGWNPSPPPRWLNPSVSQFALGWLYAAGSIVILVLSALGPYKNADGSQRSVKGWWFPVITFGLLGFSVVYYLIFIASENSNGASMAGVNMHRRRHGDDDNRNIMRQCDFCKAYAPGVAHRHARDGYLYYNDYNFPQKNQGRNVLYWLFGGPKEHHYPDLHLDEYVVKGKGMIRTGFYWVWSGMRRAILRLRR
ncbi:uncharacterized protein K441DRAFT_90733 [Cenococcum geophilum 1.58]|uniref:uncharacterized protein n=1 Tax=Cenococcum geophilum 1.58 TaxID=794803 RepID=UPI00358F9740|nr:hypothetical protein K441DRAFT_90733 [Cenococcum geophilum 1.58]